MSLKSEPYYWLECDDCGELSTQDSEFTAWRDPAQAREQATDWDGNWWCNDEHDWCGDCRDKHVCRECDTLSDDLTSLDDDGCWPVCPDCKKENP